MASKREKLKSILLETPYLEIMYDVGEAVDYLIDNGVTIEDEPTADVVGVVRCSECKHLKIINKDPVYAECEKQKLTFLLWQADTREHSCSYGERKENETSDS